MYLPETSIYTSPDSEVARTVALGGYPRPVKVNGVLGSCAPHDNVVIWIGYKPVHDTRVVVGVMDVLYTDESAHTRPLAELGAVNKSFVPDMLVSGDIGTTFASGSENPVETRMFVSNTLHKSEAGL
jgi:hypothetical protein